MKVGLIEYDAGNIQSVENALSHLRADVVRISRPEEIRTAGKLIFPGVGEARAAMEVLRSRGLDDAIRGAITSGTPLLGICIGCQVLLDSSEERDAACLGVIPGTSKRFPKVAGLKVPQIGWNEVRHGGRHPLFRGIPDAATFYFVHSYYPAPADSRLEIGGTDYGVSFSSAFSRDGVAAVQFHPEKSGVWGLRLLANFLEWEP